MTHLDEQDLTEGYYGEAEPWVTKHLGECSLCRRELENLQETLDGVRACGVPEPGPYFEARVWASLEPQLHRRTREFWRLAPAGLATAMLLLALVLASLRVWPPMTPNGGKTASSQFSQALGNHLERAQIFLTDLEYSAATATDEPFAEQQASQLLQENRKLRAQAAAGGSRLDGVLLDDVATALTAAVNGRGQREPGLLFKIRVTRAGLSQRY